MSAWTRRLVPAAALALVAVAAGCGGGSPAANSNGPVTLTMWDWGSPGAALASLVKQWNATHPKIQVKRVVQPFNTFFTLERTAITAHKGPNIIENYASPFIFSYYQGLDDLSSYVTPQQRSELSFWNLVSLGMKDSGAPYALPWGEQNVLFYYNKADFAKAGIKTPPATWAQLVSDCAALKAHGIIPISAGWKDGYYGEWWASIFAPQFMTAAQQQTFISHPDWTIPPIAKALTYMKELWQKGYMTPQAPGLTLFPQAIDNFHSGKAAIVLSLSANNANFSEYASMGSNLGAFLPPVLPGSNLTQPEPEAEGGVAWSITKWTPNPTAAYQFISYLAQASSQDTAFKINAFVPNNSGATTSTTSQAGAAIINWVTKDPHYEGIVDIAFLANVEPAYDKVIPEIISGALTPSAAMQQVEQAQQQAPPIPGT
jgi:raffinose/stachyose/melibiose transport system substrate-binding protein